MDEVRAATAHWAAPVIVVRPDEIYGAFAASRAAIAASGTVSLELAVAGVPHLIAYRVHPLSAVVFRFLRHTPYVNLVNILLDRKAVPEMLQADCTPAKLTDKILKLMGDETTRAAQRADFAKALAALSPDNIAPSRAAAREVLKIAAHG
jgi:lipid-A-disaccharide synthase